MKVGDRVRVVCAGKQVGATVELASPPGRPGGRSLLLLLDEEIALSILSGGGLAIARALPIMRGADAPDDNIWIEVFGGTMVNVTPLDPGPDEEHA